MEKTKIITIIKIIAIILVILLCFHLLLMLPKEMILAALFFRCCLNKYLVKVSKRGGMGAYQRPEGQN